LTKSKALRGEPVVTKGSCPAGISTGRKHTFTAYRPQLLTGDPINKPLLHWRDTHTCSSANVCHHIRSFLQASYGL